MLSSYWLVVPFFAQMAAMGFDEFYFHYRRELPRWERLGHPIDTLTVLVCYGWILLVPPGRPAVAVYIALAAISCLMVTKDEPVHSRYCGSGEQWLHALLFLLHPLVLIAAGLLWPAAHEAERRLPWIQYHGYERVFLALGISGTALFALYQLIYWNFLWHSRTTGTSTGSTTSFTKP